jgi:hypothetical protein
MVTTLFWKSGRMIRTLSVASLILVAAFTLAAQTPGIDPRGVMASCSIVIIGSAEEPWQKVIRPDKVKWVPPVIKDGNIVELARIPRDYMVGYVYSVRVHEVLKGGKKLKVDQLIKVYEPESFEGGVSLPIGQEFLLALSNFEPDKQTFEMTTVSKVSDPVTQPGAPFDFEDHYYRVVAERNGAIPVTEKNSKLINEIRADHP